MQVSEGRAERRRDGRRERIARVAGGRERSWRLMHTKYAPAMLPGQRFHMEAASRSGLQLTLPLFVSSSDGSLGSIDACGLNQIRVRKPLIGA